ncbi:MAG: GTPase Era [Sinimarinibacterium flocculans]|uniref:GTPase Era n=1 Tax=Sinimarinibacterium flocculans TaxID=985250 RepID=UPI003C31CC01
MRSGIVTIAGRPNVGKSSLLNALVGRKVSIVSHKPQTTRHRVQGVLHAGDDQIVFVDTPGLHLLQKRALNRVMNEAAAGALHDVDLVLFVIEAGRWTPEDQAVFDRLVSRNVPVALVVNKVDRISDRSVLLPELQRLAAMRDYRFIVPVSASKRDNLAALRDEILKALPEGPPLYPQGQVVAHDDAFTVAEVIREKLIRSLHQELPYALTVEVEHYEREAGLDRISAIVWVEREGQKKIVIGENGETLKKVGTAARRELERSFGRRLFLKLWCKVRENWSDDPKALRRFGLSGDD